VAEGRGDGAPFSVSGSVGAFRLVPIIDSATGTIPTIVRPSAAVQIHVSLSSRAERSAAAVPR